MVNTMQFIILQFFRLSDIALYTLRCEKYTCFIWIWHLKYACLIFCLLSIFWFNFKSILTFNLLTLSYWNRKWLAFVTSIQPSRLAHPCSMTWWSILLTDLYSGSHLDIPKNDNAVPKRWSISFKKFSMLRVNFQLQHLRWKCIIYNLCDHPCYKDY